MEFDFDWPSGFRGEDVEIVDDDNNDNADDNFNLKRLSL